MTKDDDPDTAYLDRIPKGPVELEQVPEAIRAIRHALVNHHDGIRGVHLTATHAEALAKKGLDKVDQANARIDDITGIPGQIHVDGGGTLGRMQGSMDRIEKLLNRATWGLITGSLALLADIAVHFLPR